MEFYEYFQSYNNYFWQWEENVEVIAIPGENTIAYRAFVIDIFEKLAAQGIPPFGSLLLTIIATNPNGSKSIDTVYSIVCNALNSTDNFELTDAISFLKLLSEVPKKYKEGKKRIMLLQAIFEGCHNIISVKNSDRIYNGYITNKHGEGKLSHKKEFSQAAFHRDFKTIAVFKNKFRTVEDIIRKMAALPQIPEAVLIPGKINTEENISKDFVEQLIENQKTFHIGSLMKRIWSGLNIPVHSALPSQQPLGGVSDLTNKGDFDKLLISEFANENLVFLSRLANNEALYIQREIPPANNNLQRVILVDVSLKNWGTPKTVAFAIMLAIARHPKTDIECTAFAIGNSFYPISIKSIDTIIDGLQILDGCLHAADGLAAFFKINPVNKNSEVFVITAASTLKQAGMLKAINDYHSAIHYWIHTDAAGNIDVFKKQQSGKKQLQHIQLPLEQLWKKESKHNIVSGSENELVTFYPILFRNLFNVKKIISTADGEIFQVTSDKNLLRFYDKLAKPNEKGWQLMVENLPLTGGEFEMGVLDNGDHLLLMLNPQNKEITLLNIATGYSKTIVFNEWRSNSTSSFVFHQQKFHHWNGTGSWRISLDGRIENSDNLSRERFIDREKELQRVSSRYASNAQTVLKNVNEIFINQVNNLVFNIHELRLNGGGHIRINKTNFTTRLATAIRRNEKEFVFPDGSTVEINRSGMFILRSSNNDIPYIYIPSVLDASLGVATENAFAGNEYYLKEPQFYISLLKPAASVLNTVKLIKELTDIGLADAKSIADNTPNRILSFCSKEKAAHIKIVLETNGAEVIIAPVDKLSQNKKKMSTGSFFKNYIEAFIENIIANGTKN